MTSLSVSTAASTKGLLDGGVFRGGIEEHAEVAVETFLARQRRDGVQHRAELIEELLRHDPRRFAAAGLRPGNRRRLGPVDGLHLAVEDLERIGHDLVDEWLNGFAVFRRVVHENAGNGVGQLASSNESPR